MISSNALITIGIIFLGIVSLIFLVRIIFSILLHFAKKKYASLKDSILKKKKNPKYEKEEDERLRHIPKAHSAVRAANLAKARAAAKEQDGGENYELVSSEEQQRDREEMNEVKIVDTVKPVGFWTSMILGQKLSYLVKSAQIINKRGKQGFWVSMIEAQEQAAGRQHGRTR